MVWFELFLTLLRELVRALVVPVRLLLYLPRRHHWRRVARDVLDDVAQQDAGAPTDPTADLESFFARSRPWRGDRPHVFLSAGEASGEGHAERLLRALPADVRCTAFGGERLQRAGAELRFGLSEHAVMGIAGVLRQMPLILRAVASYLRLLRDDPPDLIVLVDFPGLHLVMAKLSKRHRIPVLHYVAPQYWAWGPWRMRRYRRAVDATLTILPFETAFFRRFNVPAHYIGHPLLDAVPKAGADEDTARTEPLLVLLPGSRRAEIDKNLPGMLQIAGRMRAEHPDMRVVVPHENPRRTALLRDLMQQHDADFAEHHEGPLAPWLQRARLVIAKSGTGSLAACLHGAPTVVVYQLGGALSSWGYHNILSVPWIAAANLIAGRRVVPEHCFNGDDGWQKVERDAAELWPDGEPRRAVLAGLAEVRQRLGAGGASERAAAIVARFLGLGDTASASPAPPNREVPA